MRRLRFTHLGPEMRWRWQALHPHCNPNKKRKPLSSEEGWNRHKRKKDAKQLAGKLTGAITVWKCFNMLETISKTVDSSDSVWKQRPALSKQNVYFSSLIKFTAKRQAKGDRNKSSPRCFFRRTIPRDPLHPLMHTNTAPLDHSGRHERPASLKWTRKVPHCGASPQRPFGNVLNQFMVG